MDIRRGDICDALALSHLLARVWKVAYQGIFPQTFLENIQDDDWVVGFQQGLVSPDATTLVVQIDGKIVGMIAFGKGRDLGREDQIEIYMLNVLSEYQGQKIGSSLMRSVLEQIGEQRVYLKVAVKNQAAQQFYMKHGFCNSKQIQVRQIADFTFDEWLFEK